MNINDYIRETCDFLDVDFPVVIHKSDFRTSTMLAELEIDEGSKPVLHVKSDFQNQADLLFSIAHELRHLWQIQHDLFDFEKYQTADVSGAEVYNLQEEELDANAFAKLWMVANFKLEPQFKGLSDAVKTAIDKRYAELIDMYTE